MVDIIINRQRYILEKGLFDQNKNIEIRSKVSLTDVSSSVSSPEENKAQASPGQAPQGQAPQGQGAPGQGAPGQGPPGQGPPLRSPAALKTETATSRPAGSPAARGSYST